MTRPTLLRKFRLTVIAILVLIAATLAIGAGLGYASLSYDRLIPTLIGNGTFKEEFVLFSVRLPRMAVTLLAGMALALSGSILQGITRNDLADPGIVGINSGAGVGVAVFFLFLPAEPGAFVYLLPLAAFAGAIVTACLVYLFAYDRSSGLQPVKLVLMGVGFSMAMSGLMIVLVSSADRVKVEFISKWLAGSIWGTDWPFVWAMAPWLVLLIPYALFKAQALNLLSLNDPVSVGVGVRVGLERALLLLAAVALAASAVSVTGGITFIGLMAPHIAKALVGARHQLSLPVSLLMGGWLLLLADTIGRNLTQPDGVAAGIVVAMIGAPYFVYLLLRK